MNHESNPLASREVRLEQILAEYLRSVETGKELDRATLLKQHPDLAADLESFFRNRDSLQRLAAPLQSSYIDTPTLDSSPARPKALGTKLRYFGDYEILSEIARGGMGVVYKAKQVNLKRVVALKLILAGQLANQQELERFHAEAEAAAKLDHPGIVPIFEVGQHEGQHYFSMAFVEGESLAQRINQGVLPPREAVQLLRKVCVAIAYAHVEGVIHRDLKPANILLDRDGQPRVTDFGLAKHVDADRTELTASGQILGTPSYMPPEQAGGDRAKIGPASDIYSLGAILYCLITGRPPFQAATPVDTLLQVLSCEPASPSQLNPGVPRDLETICLKCLEKDAAQRYASALELAEELQCFLDGRPIKARPISAPARAWRWCRRNPALSWTIGIASFLLIVITSAYISSLIAKNAQLVNAFSAEQAAKNLAQQHSQTAETQKFLAQENAAKAKTAAELALSEKTRADQEADSARRQLYVAHMNLAQLAWDEANLGRLQQLLESHIPRYALMKDLRGWEWHYWNRLAHAEQLSWKAQRLHEDISDLVISPDGKQIAIATTFSLVCLESATAKSLFTIPARKESPNALGVWAFKKLAYSPNGKWIAATNSGGETCLCNAATGEIEHVFPMEGHVECVAFDAQSERLAVGGITKQHALGDVIIWDIAKRQVSGELEKSITLGKAEQKTGIHREMVASVAFSPNGQRLATASKDKTIKLWNLQTGKEERTLRGHTDRVTSVRFSPNGEQLATGSADLTVKLWNPKTGDVLHTCEGHRQRVDREGVNSLAFNADGTQLASAGGDRTIRIWNVATGEEAAVIRGHAANVRSVNYFPDGRLASAGGDQLVKFWDIPATQESVPLKLAGVGGERRLQIGFIPNDNTLTVLDREVKSWQLPALTSVSTSPVKIPLVNTIACSPNLGRLAASDLKLAIHVWDTELRQELFQLREHSKYINALAFSPDSRWLASSSQDKNVIVWDLSTGNIKTKFKGFESPSQILEFSPDGKYLASCTPSRFNLWNLETLQKMPLESHASIPWTTFPEVYSLAFSADGQMLATGHGDHLIRIVSLPLGREIHQLTGHVGPIAALAFTPDGKRLASGGGLNDQSIKLWDLETEQEVLTLNAHTSPIADLAFSSDGTKLASADIHGTIHLWDAQRSNQLGK
jgi:eukaryotic-like serine/threonine-protein kinase